MSLKCWISRGASLARSGLSVFAGGGLTTWLAMALAVIIALGLAGWRGYEWGYSRAKDQGEAAISRLEADSSQAQAQAESQARELLETATRRGQEAERKYMEASRTIAAQRSDLNRRRIADVSRVDVRCSDSGPVFGAQWVRDYNEALGLAHGDPAVPAAASVPFGNATNAPATGPGIRRGVTASDILTHVRDYGAWCLTESARARELSRWAEVRP